MISRGRPRGSVTLHRSPRESSLTPGTRTRLGVDPEGVDDGWLTSFSSDCLTVTGSNRRTSPTRTKGMRPARQSRSIVAGDTPSTCASPRLSTSDPEIVGATVSCAAMACSTPSRAAARTRSSSEERGSGGDVMTLSRRAAAQAEPTRSPTTKATRTDRSPGKPERSRTGLAKGVNRSRAGLLPPARRYLQCAARRPRAGLERDAGEGEVGDAQSWPAPNPIGG